jgi:hypothetical protein
MERDLFELIDGVRFGDVDDNERLRISTLAFMYGMKTIIKQEKRKKKPA